MTTIGVIEGDTRSVDWCSYGGLPALLTEADCLLSAPSQPTQNLAGSDDLCTARK